VRIASVAIKLLIAASVGLQKLPEGSLPDAEEDNTAGLFQSLFFFPQGCTGMQVR
jgi:hypothetical protein